MYADVDVFTLSGFGLEDSEPMPTVADDLRDIRRSMRRRIRRIIRNN